MSDNLKIQILKVIIVESFCQKLKVWYFRYIICNRIRRFQAISNAFLMREGQTFGYSTYSNQGIVTWVRLRTEPKPCEKLKCKKTIFLVNGKKTGHKLSIYEKSLIIDLSCNFLYLWNCMKSVWLAFFYL